MLSTTNIDELLNQRTNARAGKNWKLADEIKAYLDSQLVFVFDATWGQETHYLTEKYFQKKPADMSHRKYVEYQITESIRLEAVFAGWLQTVRAMR